MEMQLFCELTKKQLPFSYIWKCCTFRNNCLNIYFEKSLLINFSHTLDNLHFEQIQFYFQKQLSR